MPGKRIFGMLELLLGLAMLVVPMFQDGTFHWQAIRGNTAVSIIVLTAAISLVLSGANSAFPGSETTAALRSKRIAGVRISMIGVWAICIAFRDGEFNWRYLPDHNVINVVAWAFVLANLVRGIMLILARDVGGADPRNLAGD